MTVPDDFCGFADKYAETELAVVALKLQAGMKHVKPSVKSCCKLKTCRRGKPVLERDDLKVGETVKFNPEGKDRDVSDWMRENNTEGTIKKMIDHIDGERVYLLSGGWFLGGYWIKVDNVATFLFCKC